MAYKLNIVDSPSTTRRYLNSFTSFLPVPLKL
jgi:hypothetical protein